MTHPRADYFLFLEDDATLYAGYKPNTCEYLTALCDQRMGTLAALSLYSNGHLCEVPDIYAVNHGWSHSGCVAFVMENYALRQFLVDARVVQHRFLDDWAGTRLNDAVLGRWAHEDFKRPIGLHSPTLVQHIGDTSTLGNPLPRRSVNFIGDHPQHEQEWSKLVAKLTPQLTL
jgi:hypothetical protein